MRDIETINLELIFSDLEILERRIAKTTKTARMDKEAAKELEFLKQVKAHLEDGKPAASMELDGEEQELYMKEYNLLTWKPVKMCIRDRNKITRVIGIGPEIEVDFFDIHLKENSTLLLCSDGLSNMVSDEEIWRIANTSRDLREMGMRLVSLANENGGKDNIAVVLVQPDTKEVEIC